MIKSLSASVQYLKGIGPKKAAAFAKRGISTIEDLLYYFPRRYEDRTVFSSIAALKENETAVIKGTVLAVGIRQSWKNRRFSIVEVAVGDNSGRISCVWFNQPYLKGYFKPGLNVILNGKVERYSARLQISSPEFELISDDAGESLNMGRIVPVYTLPEGITQRTFRRFLKIILNEYIPLVVDFLPYDIRSRNVLLNLAKSLIQIHFPESIELRSQALRRLSFEEFLLFQIPLALRKLKRKEKAGLAHVTDGPLAEEFIACLPFKLTRSQEEVIAEIKLDMRRPSSMQRLLQGDVGSGKTVVATIASLIALQGGYQVAFMAPTELLAKQHYEKIKCQVLGVRCQEKAIKMGILTASASKQNKSKIFRKLESGDINFIIGTHALLEEPVKFKNLGLVVIDEQHKFGVGQRALLPQKGANPDVLIMTATPIPRTLAITIYGDLDVSVLRELPSGRLGIKTKIYSGQDYKQVYAVVKGYLDHGHQAYIVYPVIEESDALDIAGAEDMYEELRKGEFKEYRVGLVHGRLPQSKQDEAMRKFKSKEIDLLVSTTVLEVGIDIPNATCMVIEHAERFGLAQLHQLRGRVGRGPYESVCLLVSDVKSEEGQSRLNAMVQYSDGFKIAEEDLKIRGPGEFFGQRQHGLSGLRIANPLTQMQLLKRAREEALTLVAADHNMESHQNILLKKQLLRRFPEYEKLVIVG